MTETKLKKFIDEFMSKANSEDANYYLLKDFLAKNYYLFEGKVVASNHDSWKACRNILIQLKNEITVATMVEYLKTLNQKAKPVLQIYERFSDVGPDDSIDGETIQCGIEISDLENTVVFEKSF